jgi:hypothetical protein
VLQHGEERDAGDGILDGMGDHAGAQALAQVRHDAEEDAKDCDGNHHPAALVSVGQPEDRARDNDSDHGVLTKRTQLALEVSAKNYFFKKSGANTQQDKKPGIKIGEGCNRRKHAHCVIFRFLKIMEIDCPQGNADAKEQKQGDYEKSYGQADVQQEGLHRLPPAADQIAHANATQADAKPYDEDQDGLRDKRASIEHDSRRRPVDRSKLGRTQKRIAED